MTDHDDARHAVEQFLRNHIDTVPHLETLLMLWNNRPDPWSVEGTAKRLYITTEVAEGILADLVREGLIAVEYGAVVTYHCQPEPDRDQLIATVASTYRRELIRISKLIHSKPSTAVREFARAFRIKKDGE